ncbi:VanW family protein [Schaedlerella sp.]|uniref:VanW family protein n=1 Tax=Schaedlerella sp. TaxID=2676057 RepID=UPI00374A24EC
MSDAHEGEVLDTEQTIENLTRFLNDDWDGKPGNVQAVIEKKDAPVTEEDLAGLTDILGSYTTYYGESGEGRTKNVESGANHLNGILLRPGEEQSANEAMEPYTIENGYAEADSYESNTVVQTMGGGICQVSSTLYNALLFAELEIVERYPHSMLVSYVEASKDAAIADDLLDLVFKNNLDSPIYIQAVLAEGNLTFNIYGKETRSPDRTLTFISDSTESEDTDGTRFVATENYIGYYAIQSYAHPEITAQLWKVVTENGQEVSRDVINYSQYMAVPETYGVGVLSDDPADTDRMNSAIMTQNEETIMNTMNEILYGSAGTENTDGTQ